MFQINREKNDLIKLDPRQFHDLGFRERDHLQEWIEKNPEALDPDLLIIQKEFDGFNDTRERLDLLAVDNEGNLVIIENKLDDSGRDVVWQALKYASYCSTLKTEKIVDIFQEYLDTSGSDDDAKELLLEFLNLTEDDPLLLNGGDQRIILVANDFRKEVTSTVLWLLDRKVNIQCFRATPYSRKDDIFLQIERIIPLPETEEFIIDAREKEREEKSKSKVVQERNANLLEFWKLLKAELERRDFKLLDRVTPRGSFSLGSHIGKGKFSFCIGRNALRVELYFRKDEDKKLFDAMHKQKDEIEKAYPKTINWERLNEKKASRIKHEIEYQELDPNHDSFYDKEAWDTWINWYADNMIEFYNTLLPFWKKVK
ncbi:DUF4268 domain-containing protein [Gracilimonas sediminicola]|uniref:DUF4268 domain-containing protein n=1 Tax=Gracilimonas sediminicola TaxID=2952158 RepID=UPI0038D3F51D